MKIVLKKIEMLNVLFEILQHVSDAINLAQGYSIVNISYLLSCFKTPWPIFNKTAKSLQSTGLHNFVNDCLKIA